MMKHQTECAKEGLEKLEANRGMVTNKHKAAKVQYVKDKTKTEQCYLTLVQIEASKATKGDNEDESHIPTSQQEQVRFDAQAKFDAAKHTKMKIVNQKWQGAQQAHEQYQHQITDLEAQVRWFPSMKNSLVGFLSDNLPDRDCMIFGGHFCEESEMDTAGAINAAKDSHSSNNIEHDARIIIAGIPGLPKETPMGVLRTLAADQLESHVKTPATKAVEWALAKMWFFVDIPVNFLISALSSAVGAVPFVGGILATIVTMALMYVYDQVKMIVDDVFNGMVETVLDFFIDNALDLAFGTTEYKWTASGITVAKNLPSLQETMTEDTKAGSTLTDDQLDAINGWPGGLTQAIFPSEWITPVEKGRLGSLANQNIQGALTNGISTAANYGVDHLGNKGSGSDVAVGQASYDELHKGQYCDADTKDIEIYPQASVQDCANEVVADKDCGNQFQFNDKTPSCQCLLKGKECELNANADYDAYHIASSEDTFSESWLEGLPTWFTTAAEVVGKSKEEYLEDIGKVPHLCGSDISISEHNGFCQKTGSSTVMDFGHCMNAALKKTLEPDATTNSFAFTEYDSEKGNTVLVPINSKPQKYVCILYKCTELKTQHEEKWKVYSLLCPGAASLLQQATKEQAGLVAVPSEAELKKLLGHEDPDYNKFRKSLPPKAKGGDSPDDSGCANAQCKQSKSEIVDVAIGEAEEARSREAQKAEMKAETIQDISFDYSAAMGGDTI
jgi:hypothetical protein